MIKILASGQYHVYTHARSLLLPFALLQAHVQAALFSTGAKTSPVVHAGYNWFLNRLSVYVRFIMLFKSSLIRSKVTLPPAHHLQTLQVVRRPLSATECWTIREGRLSVFI
ncbi:hypothetical protein BDN72DRAFT_280575 [Pluteus cervinus]|uniref:Uncharacterized protein n=1 Tax=Pluteus cervinus TaxID=181527 RepID=A0ACD3AEV2_9AGAR|nr:hypothetical protein BDN72DRAFT_280575 [Pluteus cervinus]